MALAILPQISDSNVAYAYSYGIIHVGRSGGAMDACNASGVSEARRWSCTRFGCLVNNNDAQHRIGLRDSTDSWLAPCTRR